MTDLDLARQLAAAVLEGDAAAAYPLADLLSEMHASGKPLAEYCAGKFPRADRYVMACRALVEREKDLLNVVVHRQLVGEYSESASEIRRAGAAELCALRVLLSTQPDAVLKVARLAEMWTRWETGMTVRACEYVARALCVTPAQVRDKGWSHFKHMDGCGPVTLKSIGSMLERHGLRWAPDA